MHVYIIYNFIQAVITWKFNMIAQSWFTFIIFEWISTTKINKSDRYYFTCTRYTTNMKSLPKSVFSIFYEIRTMCYLMESSSSNIEQNKGRKARSLLPVSYCMGLWSIIIFLCLHFLNCKTAVVINIFIHILAVRIRCDNSKQYS